MPQHPPSSANYAPRWPAQPTQSSNERPGSAFLGINAPLPAGNFAAMPFNSNPPTQLPGLGMANGLIQPPYFPPNFSSNQSSVPFGAQLNGAGAYPVDNSFSTPPFGLSQPLTSFQPLTSHPTSGSREKSHPPTQNDTDREEGEVSDFSGNDTASQPAQRSVRSKIFSRPRADENLPPHSTELLLSPRDDDYEPTSISSDKSQYRGNSESPYNPPMTITALPEVSEGSAHSSNETRLQDDPSEKRLSGTSPITGKTVSQIRVMAQGALLGLAPHNIRFNELAKENIDPDILRQLYNEIGIKITSPVSDAKSPEKSDSIAPFAPKQPTKNGLGQGVTTLKEQQIPLRKNIQKDDSSVAGTSKPLERKELIAQMLAAKANKATTSTGPKSTESASRTTLGKEQSTVPPVETMVSPKISKAKNKAQTELARQRMEQLKKMGLKRQQPQAEKVSTSQTPSTDSTQQVATLSHPLPDRPPVPELPSSSVEVQTLQMPGFSMNASEGKSSFVPADTENTGTDSSTPRKIAVKRPRASDFDEIIPTSKKPSVIQDRLVIDISDDESMEDEDDALMLDADNDTPSFPALNPSRASAYQRSSASATPQSRVHDAESLRQKDLEIQAMRRRIAEYEEKQKAKKSNTIAPTISPSDSFKATSDQDDSIQSQAEEELLTHDAAKIARHKSASVLSSSAQSAVHTDGSKLRQIQQKLLRKQEIEAKLARFRRLEEELMAEIAKGREGRTQLLDELEHIDLETEDMEALQEIQHAEATEATSEPQEESLGNATNSRDPSLASMEVQIMQSSNQNQPTKHDSPCVISSSSEAVDDKDMAESESSSSEASDSSMSESTDDLERRSREPEAELETEPQPELEAAPELEPEPEPEQYAAQPQPSNDISPSREVSADISAAERPVLRDSTTVGEPLEEASSLHESTAVPDNKPLEVEDSADEAYSPKLDASADDEEMDTSSVSSSSHGDADMKLTPKFQEQVVMASKNDALDNSAHWGINMRKFSPYKSPLKYFRAYRYHPNYDKEVGDGYRSLTYSHKINPAQAICPYESAGGVCNDDTCEFQHWRDMVMPDDKILVEMGNQREGETPEEKEKYIEGLKVIINTMQRDQVNDFSSVASEIAAYRRRFLSDPSRILPL